MVARRQLGLRRHVVPEQPAVVDHPRDHANALARGGVEAELPGPGLERVEDDHRPVDPVAEALEAADEIEGEAVRGAGRDADGVGDAGFPESCHPVPDRLALVAGPVRVVKEEQIEAVLAEPLQAALGRHPQVAGVLARAAQRGIGESREAARPLPLSLVEVVADGTDQAE